jgi:Uma2 family endonuclease
LPMPTMMHQLIVGWLHARLVAFVASKKLGQTLFSPFPLRLRDGKYREPDVMFMFAQHASRMHELFWDGADLVMEVVSTDDPNRDWSVKRAEYAHAGIPEYWIVDPQESVVTVLRLNGDHYAVHGEIRPGAIAESVLLPGFSIVVNELFKAGRVTYEAGR